MIRFLQNTGDFFATNYFDEDFDRKVQEKSGYSADALKDINSRFSRLSETYFKLRRGFQEEKWRIKDQIKATHEFHTVLLNLLGFDGSVPEYDKPLYLSETEVIPVRHRVYDSSNRLRLLVLEMQAQIQFGDTVPDGLFEQRYHTNEGEVREQKQQRYHRSQWESVFKLPEELKLSPNIINEVVSTLFLLDPHDRPAFILLLAGNKIYLMESDKWFRGAYLEFDLELLFNEAIAARTRNYYATFYLLTSIEALVPSGKQILLEQLDEESHRNAFSVTQDLKEGVIFAVEALANEALFDLKRRGDIIFDESDTDFARQMRDDALSMVYRLLFVFYAESREDLSILPVRDATYRKGYALETLRDLELTPLHSDSARNGFFFHESITRLFQLLHRGYKPEYARTDDPTRPDVSNRSFSVRKVDSPLFDDQNLYWLNRLRVRNTVWQQIIRKLSLSREQRGRARGRISYANLGVNQLGSVYESLLAYRGFYADQDYIEVKKAPKKKSRRSQVDDEYDDDEADISNNGATFLVDRTRRGSFKEDEIVKEDHGNDRILPKGKFVYRLNGRDRQKSASYYTPESLTRLTVKYALKGILERVERGELKAVELLQITLLEPAMGAAAFHNEMINQVAESYLELRQRELSKRIDPGKYREELQKVKAYIATHNVYGVDLNPTAIELGKLSLWLNGIHSDMETPFFGSRLVCGNAVVGAWLKTYSAQKLSGRWWEDTPVPVQVGVNGIKRKETEIYHFLLPDKNMLATRGISLMKAEYPKEVRAAGDWIKKATAPLTGEDILRLKRLSAKVDELLEAHYQFLRTIDSKTQSRYEIWGIPQAQGALALLSYEEKEALNQRRLLKEAPYYKLKLVMDYWCSLWFWDVRRAAELPDRNQYWSDFEQILFFEKDEKYRAVSGYEPAAMTTQGQLFAIKNEQLSLDVQVVETPDVTGAIIQSVQKQDLFEDNKRLITVRELAENHRFFHPQLEFWNVFRERGGFDLVCGNPPWVKLQFDQKGVIADTNPEVLIRKTSASQVRKLLTDYLSDTKLKEQYLQEAQAMEGLTTFLTAVQNYPLIKGQQTNLYKCIVENTLSLGCKNGFVGLVHPEGIYDDPKGQVFRKVVYSRLKVHFQFANELSLFAEIDHHNKYGVHIYAGLSTAPNFISISNLFHPSTVEGCFMAENSATCGGYKSKNETGDFVWNTKPHPDRLVQFTEKELRILAKTFEDGDAWEGAKLVSIHSRQILTVLEKLSRFPGKVKDVSPKPVVSEGWHETNAQDNGIIRRETRFSDVDKYELIYSGPHFYVANPLYKTPTAVCKLNSDYDEINLTAIDEKFVPRTNYVPDEDLATYCNRIDGFPITWDEKGNPPVYDRWIDYYKVCFSKMLSIAGERTLQPAIIPPKVAHTNAVISTIFKKPEKTVEFAGIAASILMDFYVKTIGRGNLYDDTIQALPLGLPEPFKSQVFVRTLLLNCVTKPYSPLWEKLYTPAFNSEQWTKNDARLKPFSGLTKDWTWQTPLRNAFERRQALVEIDVLVAKALGLTLDELNLIYEVQFPVLQENEEDTWYDQNGNIVFTKSKGLTGVGVERAVWNRIKDLKAGETYEHTVSATRNELYKGKKIVYKAPFDRCDRVQDYRVAWGEVL